MSLDPVIRTFNLRKRYKGSKEEALKGITLTIQPGEFFGLLGPNAAGKSTLIAILCGIVGYSSGEAVLLGRKITTNMIGLKSRIGLVPQEIALYPSLTVLENILFFARLHGLSGRKLKTKTEEYIETFFLAEHRNKLISNCSGGIKRRVNLIAGVIHEPALILLDEPTLGVDTQLRTLISDYLTSLNRSGITLLYTTHYMKEAEQLCSRVSIIDHGLIITEGRPAELISSSPGCNDLGQLFLHLTGSELRE
ncbi:MAG: ABC transporter ATP-binding protein [Bacteroidales bacterium]|nr:ABC transporter ATP-binding protein [Bacteroidales bacterium]